MELLFMAQTVVMATRPHEISLYKDLKCNTKVINYMSQTHEKYIKLKLDNCFIFIYIKIHISSWITRGKVLNRELCAHRFQKVA